MNATARALIREEVDRRRRRELLDVRLRRRHLRLLRAPTEPRPVTRMWGVCVYCGWGPTADEPLTCVEHRLLPAVDPHYGATL